MTRHSCGVAHSCATRWRCDRPFVADRKHFDLASKQRRTLIATARISNKRTSLTVPNLIHHFSLTEFTTQLKRLVCASEHFSFRSPIAFSLDFPKQSLPLPTSTRFETAKILLLLPPPHFSTILNP